MKLLFDQNLSFRLCRQLADIYPGSSHVQPERLAQASDRAVWDHARVNGFTLVTLDADFAEMAAVLGPPPKVIWLHRGNQPTAAVEQMLREYSEAISSFISGSAACLEIY
jgi:predicted nuclease of predicted toxin-antitoxin system